MSNICTFIEIQIKMGNMKLKQIYERYTSVFTFKGRLNREKYIPIFIGIIFFFIFNYLFIWAWLKYEDYLIPNALYTNEMLIELSGLLFFILLLAYLFLWVSIIIFFICKTVQRLHDLNSSGIWIIFRITWPIAILFLSIPAQKWEQIIIIIIVLMFELMLLLKKGTAGPNKYGE